MIAATPQIASEAAPQDTVQTAATADTSKVILSLEDAINVALGENISVKIADKEIKRTEYAKRGSYASLFPQIDGSLSYQRTIKKQVMYMDFDMSSLAPGAGSLPGGQGGAPEGETKAGDSGDKGNKGLEVGRWNTWSGGITASMPVVNAQLWQSLKISGEEVELAVEKARASRLSMVSQVKTSFYAVLMAKEALKVYETVYNNALKSLEVTQMKYNAQKASEMDLVRAKTTLANAIPNLYSAANDLDLALWQLKAVMGVDLNYNMDVLGSLEDYASTLFYDLHSNDNVDLAANSTLKQMQIQLFELENNIKVNQFAYIPTLSLMFNFNYNAMTNDFNFSTFNWTPYSYVGVSIAIPIFSGGKRYHAVKQSQVQKEQLELQRLQTERQLRISAKSYLGTMESNMNGYYAAQSAVASARKGYDITETSYRLGRSTLIELNDSMLALAQAELTQWSSIYSFLVAKAQLEEQLGKDYVSE